ncbi:host cell division inhibitor Icd-like protein [Aeromonas sp.]|uniref:host cell division inhibitor Icd-like protein n=1 Tax=Aeromonas sp. TaxID=647 RepID=UPI00259024DB|nr:host cell division inhibitor Icd-like protein [Aeromonas sp.]MCX7132717.1 host cell division inhibitor Icd-like protein [Aeromonas sp.]
MTNRITPHQGRAPLTLQKITWRFLVLGDSLRSVFKAEAHTEQEARKSLPDGRLLA